MIRRIVVATMRATKAPLQALRSDRHRRPRTEQRWLCGSCQDEAMFTSQTVACPAYVTLSDTEHRMLDELPYAASMVPWTLLCCPLPAGHPGPHHALGRNPPGMMNGGSPGTFATISEQLAVLPPCAATSDDDTRSGSRSLACYLPSMQEDMGSSPTRTTCPTALTYILPSTWMPPQRYAVMSPRTPLPPRRGLHCRLPQR